MTLPARACEVGGGTYLGNVLVSATRMMQVHATFVSAKMAPPKLLGRSILRCLRCAVTGVGQGL